MYYRSEKMLQPQNAISLLNGKKTVFLSGVFDILHFGHITYLRKAKEIVGEEGKLIVALHDDESVKKVKGDNRPYMKLEERIELLCELICVDFVIPWYGWEDLSYFVLDLKPNYLAITEKSYNEKKWEGLSWEEVAKKIDAEIIKIPIIENLSSTKYSHLFE